jgi:hypothetical protein
MPLYLTILVGVAGVIGVVFTAANFFWNVYKDTHHRANVRVAVEVQQKGNRMVPVVEIMNHGPGTVTLDHFIHESIPWRRRLFRRRFKKHFASLTPMNIVLKPGEAHRQEELTDMYRAGIGITGIGVTDMMRNAYFAPTSQVRKVNRYIRKSELRMLRKMKPPSKKAPVSPQDSP